MKRGHGEVDLEGSIPKSHGAVADHLITSPKLSKARACTECKRHKIKCELKPGESSCVRCLRYNLKCISSNAVQKLMEDDKAWKSAATSQILQLQAAVSELLRHGQLPDLSNFKPDSAPDSVANQESVSPNPTPNMVRTSGVAMTRDSSQEPFVQEYDLVAAPIRSLYEVTKLRSLRSDQRKSGELKTTMLELDFISRGCIPLDEAEKLFDFYSSTMNHFLWGSITLKHGTLTSVRSSSPLLCAAILSVAALNSPDMTVTLNACYNEFRQLVTASVFDRHNTLDDIRALCIGAFWLQDLSWMLSGQAVRIAMANNLHQSLQKMSKGVENEYERVQLWYLIYVCDHHLSIAYGRPPITHLDGEVTDYEKFLKSQSVVPGDIRVVCQVALFVILTKIYHRFGSDIEQAVSEEDFPQLRMYNMDVDAWRLLWQSRIHNSPYVASYPSKGVVLHYHFAKLQLNSLSLRAISPSANLSTDRKEFANAAVCSAMSILTTVLDEPDIRDSLFGVPLFTHTIIAFSAVFLLKVALKWKPAFLNVDLQQVQGLVEQVVKVLTKVRISEKHLAHHISNGLTKMLETLKANRTQVTQSLEDELAFGIPGPNYDIAGSYGFEEHWHSFPAMSSEYLTSTFTEF